MGNINQYHMGQNVKAIRRSKNLTQDYLAEKLGVSKQSISGYEGRALLSAEVIYKLAEVLVCSTDEIFYGKKSEAHQIETDVRELYEMMLDLKQEVQEHKEDYEKFKSQNEDED